MAKNRSQVQVTPRPVQARTEPPKPVLASYVDDDANNSLARLFKPKHEFYPTFHVDYSNISLNQPHLVIEGDLLKFVDKHNLFDKSQAWISDGHDRILATVSKSTNKNILIIHWLTRQTVVVRGDERDL